MSKLKLKRNTFGNNNRKQQSYKLISEVNRKGIKTLQSADLPER
jgi:hypothetical protein